jgi:hypothetical protein
MLPALVKGNPMKKPSGSKAAGDVGPALHLLVAQLSQTVP